LCLRQLIINKDGVRWARERREAGAGSVQAALGVRTSSWGLEQSSRPKKRAGAVGEGGRVMGGVEEVRYGNGLGLQITS
jgi:hypothetical protein